MFFRFVSKFGLALAPLGVLSGVVSNFLGPLSGESESDSSQLDVSDICLSDLGNDTKREETNRANRAPPIALSQKAPKQISHLPIVNGAMYNSRKLLLGAVFLLSALYSHAFRHWRVRSSDADFIDVKFF